MRARKPQQSPPERARPRPEPAAGGGEVAALMRSLQGQIGNAGVAQLVRDGSLTTERALARQPGHHGADPHGMHDGRGGAVAVVPPAPAGGGPLAALDSYRAAVAAGDWEGAVVALNGATTAEIDAEIATLDQQTCRRLLAALRNSMRIGSRNNVEDKLKRRGGISRGRIFGTPDWQQTPNHAASAGGQYSFDMWIQFTPDPLVVDCQEIAVIQTVRLVNTGTDVNAETLPHLIRRQNARHTAIDRIEGRRHGFYGYENTGRPSGDPGTQTTAGAGGNMRAGGSNPVRQMRYYDGPGDTMTGVSFEFETAIVARSGPQQGLVYSVVLWGFDVDASGRLTAHRVRLRDRVSSDFRSARRHWNTQARGAAAQRNDPNQRTLPSLR